MVFMGTSLNDLAEESTKGSFILVSGIIVATIISAVVSILIARFLGPEDYGLYSLSLVIPQVFFLVTDFGIREGIIKFTIEAKKKGQLGLGIKIIKYSILIRALAGILSFLVLFVSADFISANILQRPNLGFFVRVASVAVIFQAIYSTSTHAYIGLDRALHSSIITQIQSLSKAVFSILLVVLGFGVGGAVLGYVFGFIAGGIVGGFMLFWYFRGFNEVVDSEQIALQLKKLMKYGVPLYFSFLMIGFMPQFFDILLAFFTSNYDIGNFKATANFMLLLAIVAQTLTTSLLPAFTKLNGASSEDTKSFFSLSHKYMTLVIIPVTVLLMVFSNELIQFTYGSRYTDAGFFLAIYSSLYLLTGIGYLNLPSLFNGMGKTRETLKMNAVTFLLALSISPLTTNWFGITGLILTIVFAYAMGSTYGMYKAKKILNVSFDLNILYKIYVVAFLSIFPAFLLVMELGIIPKMLIGVGVYFFVYLTLIPLAKVVNRFEIELLKKYVIKIKPLFILKPVFNYFNKILKVVEG
jgi:stage V sporulation protein B